MAARTRRPRPGGTPGGPAPSGTGKWCGPGPKRFRFRNTTSYKIRGQFGTFFEQNLGTDLSVWAMIWRKIVFAKASEVL
jgi:hypothetical protein